MRKTLAFIFVHLRIIWAQVKWSLTLAQIIFLYHLCPTNCTRTRNGSANLNLVKHGRTESYSALNLEKPASKTGPVCQSSNSKLLWFRSEKYLVKFRMFVLNVRILFCIRFFGELSMTIFLHLNRDYYFKIKEEKLFLFFLCFLFYHLLNHIKNI